MSLNRKTAWVLARSLAANLRKRLPTKTVTEGVNASNDPTITVNDGSPAAGEDNFFMRIVEQPVVTGQVDGIGQTQQSYGPHRLQLAMEATAADAARAVPKLAALSLVMVEVMRLGCVVETYLSANTVVPVDASITGTALSEIMDIQYGLTNSI